MTAVGLITITASTYLIYGSDRIYGRIEPLLRVFERARPTASIDLDERARSSPSTSSSGSGASAAPSAPNSPTAATAWSASTSTRAASATSWAIPVVYGDAEDPDLPEQLPLQRTRWVVSTLRGREANLGVGRRRSAGHGYSGGIAVADDDEGDERELLRAGADLAIRPLHVAAGPLLQRMQDAP